MTQNLLSICNDTLNLAHIEAFNSQRTHNSNIFGYSFPTSVGRLGYRILLSISAMGYFFSMITPRIIARELTAGKINHMYLSQNSLILCFIILIFKWLIIVERRFLPAPLARTCIFAPRFIIIVLTTWLTPYRFYASASNLFISEEINLARMTSNRFQKVRFIFASPHFKNYERI